MQDQARWHLGPHSVVRREHVAVCGRISLHQRRADAADEADGDGLGHDGEGEVRVLPKPGKGIQEEDRALKVMLVAYDSPAGGDADAP